MVCEALKLLKPIIVLFAPTVGEVSKARAPIIVLPALATERPDKPTALPIITRLLPVQTFVSFPTKTLFDPVTVCPAFRPMAVFCPPAVSSDKDSCPTAVLNEPVIFSWRAAKPTAVFRVPVVFLFSDRDPTAVLTNPVAVLFWRAR